MVRRVFVAIAFAACAAFPLSAAEARDASAELAAGRAELRALFERAPGVIVENENGITVQGMATEVVLARVGPDGKLVTTCVDSEAAARRFFEAPIEQVGKGARRK